MRKILEFTLLLPVAAILWFFMFPSMGATSSNLPVELSVIVTVAYAALATFLFQFFYGAEMLIGARFNSKVVLACLLLAQIGVPLAAFCLLGLFVTGLVQSYLMLALATAGGFLFQFLVLALFGGVREKFDEREVLKGVTLHVTTSGVYRPRIEKGEIVPDGLFTLDPAGLKETETLLERAWHEGSKGRSRERCDALLVLAIPELEGCGFLGILRLQVAYRVLAQSYHAIGDSGNENRTRSQADYLNELYAHGALF